MAAVEGEKKADQELSHSVKDAALARYTSSNPY